MERMVSFSRETGGFFQERDLQDYRPEWVEPITADYKGYTVCEIPPNGHGITVLMALNILKGLPLSQERDSADTYHKILEAIKLAFADTRTYVADPRYMRTRVADLLSEDYAARRRALIGERALLATGGGPLLRRHHLPVHRGPPGQHGLLHPEQLHHLRCGHPHPGHRYLPPEPGGQLLPG